MKVSWASYNGFSGPRIIGTRRYVAPDKPTGWDLIVAAVAEPESGFYDTVVLYDGTAVTAGLFQWTLTSGRLQKLLARMMSLASHTFWSAFGPVLPDKDVTLSPDGTLSDTSDSYRKPLTKNRLRAIFTPPDGRVPRRGAKWEDAVATAIAFNTAFANPIYYSVQTDFFYAELVRELAAKRPWLDGLSIRQVLPNPLNETVTEKRDGCLFEYTNDPYPAAVRALFWSCFQNNPVTAMKYLNQSKGGPDFVRRVAHSRFGNWGIEKAKTNKRESRYSKVVKVVNRIFKAEILPVNP